MVLWGIQQQNAICSHTMKHKLMCTPYTVLGGTAKKKHPVLFFWFNDAEQIVQIKDRLLLSADSLAAVRFVRHK